MKKLFTFLISVLLVLTLSICAFAYDYADSVRTSLIYDFADLIPDDDEAILLSKLEEISETNKCEVSLVTVNSTDGKDITPFADDYYDYNGFGYGENDDGIMLVISMETREFAFTTHGTGIDIFTDYNLLTIENKMLNYLSQGDYTTAFACYEDECNRIFENYQSYTDNGNNYYHNDDYYYKDDYYYDDYYKKTTGEKFTDAFSLKWIGFSLIAGIIIAFVYTSYLKSQLKTVRSKYSASDYVVPGSLHLTLQKDIFTYSNLKKTPKPKSNSSGRTGGSSSFGGGSSTHRSSSGRTHGGSRGRF